MRGTSGREARKFSRRVARPRYEQMVISEREARDEDALTRLAERLGYVLDDDQRTALIEFAALVARWGQRTDLVAAKDAPSLIEILFADAFVLADGIREGATVLDVGAGAGAPGIPLALVRPDLQVTLLEPRRRRVAFMRTAVGTLDLVQRVKVVEGRAETHADAYDVAYARATFEPDEWIRRGFDHAAQVVLLLGEQAPPKDRPAVWERRYATHRGVARHMLAFEGG